MGVPGVLRGENSGSDEKNNAGRERQAGARRLGSSDSGEGWCRGEESATGQRRANCQSEGGVLSNCKTISVAIKTFVA